jgi:phosphatidylserine/phosphatidylglycerophosphate/cardiolipin synthase-like enzyme
MKINKDAVFVAVIIILLGVCGQLYYSYRIQPARSIAVYYNQDIAANEKVIKLIQDADQFVYFAVYTFTREDIKDALLGAKYRGLEVRGLVDRDQTQGLPDQAKIVKTLRDAGIPVAIDHHQGIMHLKVLATDKAYASGSYNWTRSATEINDEVLEIGTDKIMRSQYQKLLQKLLEKYPPE